MINWLHSLPDYTRKRPGLLLKHTIFPLFQLLFPGLARQPQFSPPSLPQINHVTVHSSIIMNLVRLVLLSWVVLIFIIIYFVTEKTRQHDISSLKDDIIYTVMSSLVDYSSDSDDEDLPAKIMKKRLIIVQDVALGPARSVYFDCIQNPTPPPKARSIVCLYTQHMCPWHLVLCIKL